MFISVLICTRNRAGSLRKSLESLFVPDNVGRPEWEIVVVCNGSGLSDSELVCEEFQRRFPDSFRFFIEEQIGKSHALNRAIAESKGDLLAMTDDDVCFGPNYIQAIRAVFLEHTAAGVQGRVLLDCEGGRPIWMNDEMAAFMSMRDYGNEVLEWGDNLTGTNMVIRREVVRRIGGFSPALGAGAVGFMEDSEFSSRMRRAGFRLLYAPQIVVWHQLPRERLTQSFFLKRYFQWGCSEAYLCPLPAPLWRFGGYALKELALREAAAICYRVAGHSGNSANLRMRCKARHELGFFWQHWLFKRDGRRVNSSTSVIDRQDYAAKNE